MAIIKAKIALGISRQAIGMAKESWSRSTAVIIENQSSRALFSDNWTDPWGNIYFSDQLPFVPPRIPYGTYTDYPKNREYEEFEEVIAVPTVVQGHPKTKAALVWRFSGKANLFLLAAMNTGPGGDNECYFELSHGRIHAADWMKAWEPAWVTYNQLHHLNNRGPKSNISLEGSMDNEKHSTMTLTISDA